MCECIPVITYRMWQSKFVDRTTSIHQTDEASAPEKCLHESGRTGFEMLNRQKLETRNQPVFDIHPLWRQKKEKAEILVWGREKTCIFKCSQANVLSEQPANDVEVHMQHMWPQALSVPTVKCLKANCAHRVRAVNPVCPADPVLQAVLPSATSLYNSTDYSSKNNLPCTHWHTFFSPPPLDLSLSPHPSSHLFPLSHN